MHGKYAFARIETVTERRRLRRLFLRFSFADCMHLAGGCRNEVEITAKTQFVPFANCTKKQLFRRGYASIFLLLACSLFCTVFFALEECFLFVGNGLKRLRNVQTSTCFFYFRQKRCYWLFCTFVLGKFSLHYIYF